MLSLRIVVCVDQEDSAEARWSGDANIRRALLLFVAKYNILIQLLSHPVAEAGFLVKKTSFSYFPSSACILENINF